VAGMISRSYCQPPSKNGTPWQRTSVRKVAVTAPDLAAVTRDLAVITPLLAVPWQQVTYCQPPPPSKGGQWQ
jgi:hypothetical protein